jgi:hypothetical protein
MFALLIFFVSVIGSFFDLVASVNYQPLVSFFLGTIVFVFSIFSAITTTICSAT